MLQLFLEFFLQWRIPESQALIFSYIAITLIVLIIGIGTVLLIQYVILPILFRLTKDSRLRIFRVLRKRRFLERLTLLLPPLVFSVAADSYGKYTDLVNRILEIYIIIVLTFLLHSLITVIDDVYRSYEISKKRPIKGFLQIMELIVIVVVITVVVATWIGQSPAVMLGGIGAFTALISVIFKDTLLGFVAGIQLTNNDMVRIGDWIEMPKYAVDGTVTDITLISVKVNNFDNTSTTVPAYALISDSFKNWRSMMSSGARRLKRAVYIDMTSIQFCSEDMLDRFSQNEYLQEYIESKREEFLEIKKLAPAGSKTSTQHQLTNIGVFRIYLERYLQKHPHIHPEMTILVRQLPAENRGLPLEIYCFSKEIDFILYENIQSDIFDHIYAIAGSFDLRLFQEPTGHDMRQKS